MSIRRLSDDAINRIAAGEILVRPWNAVKELVENSIDAKATYITVILGNGGLQSIQIIDNGVGIQRRDHHLVCERFATSKISGADDLSNGALSSFGFRGEALASMSLVGHVSIYSKSLVDADEVGYESRYSNGVLLPDYPIPVPFNGESGTRIIIDDLFYNNVVRKNSFKSPSAEFKRIVDLISKFAIAFPGIGFKVKKAGQTDCDLVEECIPSLSSENMRLARIESLMGVIQSDLVTVHPGTPLLDPLESMTCIIANPASSITSRSAPTTSTLIIVNDRLVDSPQLVKLIESEISSQFQTKSKFIYIQLRIKSSQVDVNVCPTKAKVVFANQSEVNKWIVNSIMQDLNALKRVKAIKLHKIEFNSINVLTAPPSRPDTANTSSNPVLESREQEVHPPSVIKLEFPSSQSTQPISLQPFRIHTCPKQNQFVPPPISASQTQTFLSLTQIVNEHAPVSPKAKRSRPNGDISQLCLEVIDRDYNLDLSALPHNPRDLVYIGDVSGGFVLCQYFSHLCVCNLEYVFQTLVGKYLLVNSFCLKPVHGVDPPDYSILPSWVAELLCNEEGQLRFPTIRYGHVLTQDAVEWIINELTALDAIPSADSVAKIVTMFVQFLMKFEYLSQNDVMWNEVVKNKTFYIGASSDVSSSAVRLLREPVRTPAPPAPLNVDNSSHFFFREVISLKELYKEFERC